MTDSSIGIQAISPFAGTPQGRDEAFRDQSAQAAATKFAEQQRQEEQEKQAATSSDSTHEVDVTV